MKKLFLAVALIATTFTANAVDKIWDISNFTVASYEVWTVVDQLGLGADVAKAIAIDANNKTYGTYSCTKRLKMGGSGEVGVARYLAIKVDGNSTLGIAVMSSSSGVDRWCQIKTASGVFVDSVSAPGVTDGLIKPVSYVGGPTTLCLFSSNSGINFYVITATNVTAGDPTPVAVSDAIASSLLSKVGNDLVNPTNLEVEVYSVLGAKVLTSSAASISVSGLASGVYVAKTAEGTLKFIK